MTHDMPAAMANDSDLAGIDERLHALQGDDAPLGDPL